MNSKPVSKCIKESCTDCKIKAKLACHFNPVQLLLFYVITIPSFIIGGIALYDFGITSFVVWFVIFGSYFLLIGIRVLCTHCPHYNDSSFILKCRGNFGVPKLWKYRRGPMNNIEKGIMISGFIVIWGYPVIFISLMGKWILLAEYILSVILFFTLLRKLHCKRCINFTCPLNSVDIKIREEFLNNSGNS